MKLRYVMILLPAILLLLFSGCMILSKDGNKEGGSSIATENTQSQADVDAPEKKGVVSEQVHHEESEAVANVKKVYIGISDFEILNDEAALSALAKDIPQTLTQAFIKSRYIKAVDRQQFDK